jgi:C4-type Zn-finger protein
MTGNVLIEFVNCDNCGFSRLESQWNASAFYANELRLKVQRLEAEIDRIVKTTKHAGAA